MIDPRSIGALLLSGALLTPSVLAAQPAPDSVRDTEPLSLTDALDLAHRNSPSYLAAQNDRGVADWEVRAAYGGLLPSASANGSVAWQGSGEERFGSVTTDRLGLGDQPAFYSSSYSIGASLQLNGNTLLRPGQAKAARRQTEASIRVARVSLDQTVTLAYLQVLRQRQEVTLTEQELERARFNLRLATAQRDVGVVTPLDVHQAEVAVGRAEVAVLRARNTLRTARLRLRQQMGVGLDREFRLTSEFGLTAPPWDEGTLYRRALEHNPNIRAQRTTWEVQDYQVRMAKSAYWPSLSLSAGISGFTQEASNTAFMIAQAQASTANQIAQCELQNELFRRLTDPLPTQDCSQFTFTDADRNGIIEENDVFPFSFETSPPSASLSISLPIFQGLGRQRSVEAAQAARHDAELRVREQELALQADVSVTLGEVETAWESALIEDRNQEFADEQLRLARERYRVGAISFVELVEAETVKAQADRARLAAIFTYHDAITRLETVVGTSLRNDGGS